MRRWRVHPAKQPLRGALRVPGDKSIGHRAVIFASLADGTSVVTGLSGGEDNRATRAALAAMGIVMEPAGEGILKIHGRGLRGLRAPSHTIDCGNSGTTMRLLAGLLAPQYFGSVLVGDASLMRRPMARVTRPLRNRGARIEGVIDPVKKDEVAPLTVSPLPAGALLNEFELAMSVASAQVKSALLISGLYAAGPTAITEPVLSRDHTERMLSAMGAPLQTAASAVMLDPAGWDRKLRPLDLTVPGDISSAVFAVAAAHIVPGSQVVVRGVGVNPTRTGALDVLRDMGGGVVVEPKGDAAGEPLADLSVGVHAPAEVRSAARVGGELGVRSIDEVPALVAVAATCTRGASEFRDLAELRVKESDRIAALVDLVRAFGLAVEAFPDGLRVQGGKPRGGGVVKSLGDHRIAMSGAILALAADSPTMIDDVECVDTSFPGFAAMLTRLGAEVEVLDEG